MKRYVRLNAIVDLIERDDTILDIGTDHAFVPIFIALKKITSNTIYASELRSKPLEIANENIQKYGLRNKIITFQSDGTQNIDNYLKYKIDTFVIAGLGGSSIVKILKDTKNNPNTNLPKKLILNPNNVEYKVRKWLKYNGYKIKEEIFISDAKEKKTIIIKAIKTFGGFFISNRSVYVGPILTKKAINDENIYNYFLNKKKYLFSVYEKSGKVKHLKEYKKFNNAIKWIDQEKKDNNEKRRNN